MERSAISKYRQRIYSSRLISIDASSAGISAAQPGFVIHIMVNDIQKTMEAITTNGCEIVQPVGADAPEITAKFRDPGGNTGDLPGARMIIPRSAQSQTTTGRW